MRKKELADLHALLLEVEEHWSGYREDGGSESSEVLNCSIKSKSEYREDVQNLSENLASAMRRNIYEGESEMEVIESIGETRGTEVGPEGESYYAVDFEKIGRILGRHPKSSYSRDRPIDRYLKRFNSPDLDVDTSWGKVVVRLSDRKSIENCQ